MTIAIRIPDRRHDAIAASALARWVLEPDQAEQRQPLLDLVGALPGVVDPDSSLRHGDDSQPPFGQGVVRLVRALCLCDAAGQYRIRGALDQKRVAGPYRHAPPARVERVTSSLRRADFGADVRERRAKHVRAASIGSPWAIQRPSRSTASPVEHRRATPATSDGSERVGLAVDDAVGLVALTLDPHRAGGVHTSTTLISLRVNVPVLSVQMNVVEPSVSTASSRRTKAAGGTCAAPDRERQRDGGQQPLRHERHGDADREQEAVRCRRSDQHGDAEESQATADTRSSR